MARTKVELRALLEESVKGYNEAVQNGKFDDAHKLNGEIEQIVNEYTSIARNECFDELKAAENPMIEAIKRLTYPTIRVRDTKEGDEKIPVRIVEDVEKPIDLLRLHKSVDGGIGEDKKWANMIEKFNFLMTVQKASDLGVNPKSINDSYAMSQIAKDIDLGKTPTSKTNILRTLQAIVTAMIGDGFKATSHDVNFLMSIYSRKNRKALTVTCANHKYMRQYMAEICHHIILGKSYEVDHKKARNK